MCIDKSGNDLMTAIQLGHGIEAILVKENLLQVTVDTLSRAPVNAIAGCAFPADRRS